MEVLNNQRIRTNDKEISTEYTMHEIDDRSQCTQRFIPKNMGKTICKT